MVNRKGLGGAVEVVGHFDFSDVSGCDSLQICQKGLTAALQQTKLLLRHYGWEIRSPGFVPKTDNNSINIVDGWWHQDSIPGYRTNVLTWSNIQPTVFRLTSTTEEWTSEEGDIVLFANDLVEHRPPFEIAPTRVFARYVLP